MTGASGRRRRNRCDRTLPPFPCRTTLRATGRRGPDTRHGRRLLYAPVASVLAESGPGCVRTVWADWCRGSSASRCPSQETCCSALWPNHPGCHVPALPRSTARCAPAAALRSQPPASHGREIQPSVARSALTSVPPGVHAHRQSPDGVGDDRCPRRPGGQRSQRTR